MAQARKFGPPFTDTLSQNTISADCAISIWAKLEELGYAIDDKQLLFGSGIDGDVTIVGTVTLTEDKYYNNLTVPVGTILDVSAGVKVFVKGTATLAGTIRSLGINGSDAVLDVGGAGVIAGASGTTGAGTNASAGFPGYQPSVGGNGGGSGLGGAGDGGAGGLNLSAIISNGRGSWNGPTANTVVLEGRGQDGQAGSSGAGDGAVNKGGGGGGAPTGSAACVLFFNNSVASPTVVLQTIGGNGGKGGDGAAGNSGGGSGAGGGGTGAILLVTGTSNNVNGTLTRTPGTAGAGGAASGTGVAGSAGQAGTVGGLYIHQLATNTFIIV